MPKVLYIGNYRDFTGWGEFATRQILALDAAGVDVACRPIKLNGNKDMVPERILQLEQKRGTFDIVIQNVLPHYTEYSGHFSKNIAYFMVETSNFNSSTWANHVNLLDEVWVPSTHNQSACRESNVVRPIKVIPTAVDLSQFDAPPPPLPLRDNFRDDFIFYTIGEFTSRKNMGALLKAFHLEFDKSESVQLMIKTSPTGLGQNPQETIQTFINNVKAGLKLSQKLDDYKQEIIICEHTSSSIIPSIHMTGDAFVSTSHGEAVCLPALDAMGYGRSVIAPRHTGFVEYLTDDCAWLVDTYEDSVFGAMDTFGDLLTGRESWYEIPVPVLRRAMRSAYMNKVLREIKVENARKRIQDFSYEKVGKVMKEALL
jgi:glycosyltransferase involved in cell wall biosynthesis